MPPVWLPSHVEWNNFLLPFQRQPVLRWYGNTMILVCFNVFGALASSSLVAYGFARMRFRGRYPALHGPAGDDECCPAR